MRPQPSHSFCFFLRCKLAAPIPSAAAHAPGSLFVYNKIETFKAVDKQGLLNDAAGVIWADMLSGAAAEDPGLLNRFVLIVHADLKTWKFYYWFCFPGLSIPPAQEGAPAAAVVHAARPQLAREAFGATGLAALASSVTAHTAEAAEPLQSAFILARVADGSFAVHRLAEHTLLAPQPATEVGEAFLCVVDPCTLDSTPGWTLRNLLCLAASVWKLPAVSVICYKVDATTGELGHSLVLRLNLPPQSAQLSIDRSVSCPKAVGWEMDAKGKPRPRLVKMGAVMDPRRLAESAVDLNLQLMRWRLMPELAVGKIAETKCLLLGAGTLGCQVARSLMGWGVRTISFVDCGRVSFSNPVRQSLFEFEDCTGGGKPKAEAAAAAVRRIFPGVVAASYDLSIPMPGHPLPESEHEKLGEDVKLLDGLIQSHDVIFLLTDTRESRWLPTLLATDHGKLALTVALGFDSYLVMRHGISPARPPQQPDLPADLHRAQEPDPAGPGDTGAPAPADDAPHLGCYFCADVVAPADVSTPTRHLDPIRTLVALQLQPENDGWLLAVDVRPDARSAMHCDSSRIGRDIWGGRSRGALAKCHCQGWHGCNPAHHAIVHTWTVCIRTLMADGAGSAIRYSCW